MCMGIVVKLLIEPLPPPCSDYDIYLRQVSKSSKTGHSLDIMVCKDRIENLRLRNIYTIMQNTSTIQFVVHGLLIGEVASVGNCRWQTSSLFV